jgi:hypothetical protein
MMRIVAAQTLNLILLDAAAREKHSEIVAASRVMYIPQLARHSFSVLCASSHIEKYHIKNACLGSELPILYIILGLILTNPLIECFWFTGPDPDTVGMFVYWSRLGM